MEHGSYLPTSGSADFANFRSPSPAIARLRQAENQARINAMLDGALDPHSQVYIELGTRYGGCTACHIPRYIEWTSGHDARMEDIDWNHLDVEAQLAGMLKTVGLPMVGGMFVGMVSMPPPAPAAREMPEPFAGQKVYRVYVGDAKPGGASWTPVKPSGNFHDAAGLPSGGPSGANNSGRFVIEGTLRDPSAVVKTRAALPLDGTSGGVPEYIIPNPIDSGAVQVDRVSAVNPEF